MKKLLLCVVGMIALTATLAPSAQEQPDAVVLDDDERLLESAGLPTEGPGLLEFFHARARTEHDAGKIDELVRRAREKSIVLAKGALFSPTQTGSQWLRFNAAYSASAPLVRFLSAEIRGST